MLKKLTAYLLAIVGLVGFGFFEHYNGSVIPYPTLWFILSILIGLAGVYLIAKSKVDKVRRQQKQNEARINDLKQHSENILLTLDNCEIRENKYYKQGPDVSRSTSEFFESTQKPQNYYRQEYIEQSAIIYYYKTIGETIRMTSQSFPFNARMLSDIIENKKLFLYVNRSNKNDYVFDFTD